MLNTSLYGYADKYWITVDIINLSLLNDTSNKQNQNKIIEKTSAVLTVVVVITSSVTTFNVSTTEMYPRRLAIAKAVLPFWRGREGKGILWYEPMRSHPELNEPTFPSKITHSLWKNPLQLCSDYSSNCHGNINSEHLSVILYFFLSAHFLII